MNFKVIAVLLFTLTIFCTPILAQGLLYFSQRETDWFTAGIYQGHVHSNDMLRFRDLPVEITGVLSTAYDRFRFDRGVELEDLDLRNEPEYRRWFPILQENIYLQYLRNNANPWIDGRLSMIRAELREGVIAFYRRPLGTEDDEEFITAVYQHNGGGIYVDGQMEISGIITRNFTIAASGNIWLIDDLRREGTNEIGRFDDENEMMRSFAGLGLISEQNIIIKNNIPNGRENGWNDGNGENHSIVINAGLMALDGSLKIQHTNADWERYQGPEPDERGVVYLTGCLYQKHGFPLHNDNHDGTGYYVDYKYDMRFYGSPPPYFRQYYRGGIIPIEYAFHGGLSHNVIAEVSRNAMGEYLWGNKGCEVRFLDAFRVEIERGLNLNGSPEEIFRVTFPCYDEGDRASIRIINAANAKINLKHVNVANGVELYFECDSVQIDSCTFEGPVYFRGNYVKVTHSQFTNDVELGGWNFNIFEHNLVEGSVSVSGNPRFLEMTNNTIINPDGNGIFLDTYRNADIRNNIIANCERGIVNDHWQDLTLEYNNVLCDENYVDCDGGIGSISVNPRFIDPDNGNYHLAWNSPCIDAGHPDYPHDPDGTRSDMGAYPFDQRLSVREVETIPNSFSITVSPNPFNRSTLLHIASNRAKSVRVTVFDLMGREVVTMNEMLTAGSNRVTVDGASFSGAGVYFARIELNGRAETVKLVYLP